MALTLQQKIIEAKKLTEKHKIELKEKQQKIADNQLSIKIDQNRVNILIDDLIVLNEFLAEHGES